MPTHAHQYTLLLQKLFIHLIYVHTHTYIHVQLIHFKASVLSIIIHTVYLHTTCAYTHAFIKCIGTHILTIQILNRYIQWHAHTCLPIHISFTKAIHTLYKYTYSCLYLDKANMSLLHCTCTHSHAHTHT